MLQLESYRTRPVAFMFAYIRARLPSHALIFGSVLVAVGCALGSQYAVKNLIDVVAQDRGAEVWTAFLILIGLIIADNMSWRIGGWTASRCFVAVAADVRLDLFAHLTHHAPSYFADRLPGMLAGRITTTANAFFTILNTTAWQVLPPCFAVIGAIAILATVNLPMAGGLMLVAALLVVAIFRLARHGTPRHQRYAADAAVVEGELVDVISNMHTVRLFGATLQERDRLGGKIAAESQARQSSLRYLEWLRLFHAATTAALTGILLAWVILLWRRGQATPGDIVLVSSLGFAILHGTRDLAVALVDLTQHVARLSEAITALLLPHALPDAPDARPLRLAPEHAAAVAFENVDFAYPERGPILSDFDLQLAPGERVGLVGPSGAGKSTVLTLLQRFYDVDAGRIAVNGQDIRSITQDSLHAAIAVVPQDISLFHRSISDNIRYGRPQADDADVMAAARAAHCLQFIEALPQGFNTIVGQRGLKLSGGQRQRLAIARAFLKDAPILILDEATSALDSASEAAIQAALERLMRGRSVIAIAHRLSTLRPFDRIVVMQAGRVVDQGRPAELAARPGLYRELLQHQADQTMPERGVSRG